MRLEIRRIKDIKGRKEIGLEALQLKKIVLIFELLVW